MDKHKKGKNHQVLLPSINVPKDLCFWSKPSLTVEAIGISAKEDFNVLPIFI